MLSITYGLRSVFATTRGCRLFTGNALAAFGLISGGVQFVGQLFPTALPAAHTVVLSSFTLCLIWGFVRAYPRRRVRHDFQNPDMTIIVEVGDLFEHETDLVVGFSDTFDTSTDHDRIISRSSVQGQLVHRIYDGDHERLDADLAAKLRQTGEESQESRESKPHGKLVRYPLGTVVVLNHLSHRIFAVAYSRMGVDCIAKSSVDDLWLSLNRLWDAVYQHGQRGSLAIPVVGSGLARVDALNKENLLKMILLSFVAKSREALRCRELHVVISPSDLETIDLLEVSAFLRTL